MIFYPEDSLYLHAFKLFPLFGPRRLQKISAAFPNYKTAFHASFIELLRSGIGRQATLALTEGRGGIKLEQERARLEKENITLITTNSTDYPRLLKEIPDPPPLLYVRGALAADELVLSVVGTRRSSAYGKAAMETILAPIITQGITVGSGLAYGIDAAAHNFCVSHQTRTIAVLAGGVDAASLYPRAHVQLAEKILHYGGAIVSEYPPGCKARKENFIARNRIISGIAAGTLIVECPGKSGARITAQYAVEQNRSVYAIPGSILSRNSEGPHTLLKEGARLITEARDILEDLRIPMNEVRAPHSTLAHSFTPEARLIIEALSTEAKDIEALAEVTGLSINRATAALTSLEMAGAVQELDGRRYAAVKKLLY